VSSLKGEINREKRFLRTADTDKFLFFTVTLKISQQRYITVQKWINLLLENYIIPLGHDFFP